MRHTFMSVSNAPVTRSKDMICVDLIEPGEGRLR